MKIITFDPASGAIGARYVISRDQFHNYPGALVVGVDITDEEWEAQPEIFDKVISPNVRDEGLGVRGRLVPDTPAEVLKRHPDRRLDVARLTQLVTAREQRLGRRS